MTNDSSRVPARRAPSSWVPSPLPDLLEDSGVRVDGGDSVLAGYVDILGGIYWDDRVRSQGDQSSTLAIVGNGFEEGV